MGNPRAKHYVNNKDFYQAIIDYQARCVAHRKIGKEIPVIPNYIGECIQMICRKLSLKWNFSRYTFIQEMIEDGEMHCCAAVHKFNSKKSTNPFSYFTTIAWNAFVRRLEIEAEENAIKHKNLEDMFLLSDEFYNAVGGDVGEQGYTRNRPYNENDGLQRHYEVIGDHEAKLARKREKTRQNSLQKRK